MRTADGSRITKLTTSHSGPAFMLSFELDSGTQVDIDLVAAFSFEPQSFRNVSGIWKNLSESAWLKGDFICFLKESFITNKYINQTEKLFWDFGTVTFIHHIYIFFLLFNHP